MLTSKNGNMRTSLGLKTKEGHILGQRGHILGQVSHLGQSGHILGQVSHLRSGVLGLYRVQIKCEPQGNKTLTSSMMNCEICSKNVLYYTGP